MGLSVEKSLKHTPYPYSKENIYIKKLTNTRLIPNATTTFVRVRPSHLYQKNKQKKLYITDFNLYQKLFINPGTNLYQGTNPGTTVCTRPAQYKKKKIQEIQCFITWTRSHLRRRVFCHFKKSTIIVSPRSQYWGSYSFLKIFVWRSFSKNGFENGIWKEISRRIFLPQKKKHSDKAPYWSERLKSHNSSPQNITSSLCVMGAGRHYIVVLIPGTNSVPLNSGTNIRYKLVPLYSGTNGRAKRAPIFGMCARSARFGGATI